jgi:hypothetical protein
MNHVHFLISPNYGSAEVLSAYTSIAVGNPYSSSCTTEDKFRMDSTKTVTPIRRVHQDEKADLRERRAELERKKQDLGKRRVQLSQLEREKQAVAGQVMALKQELTEQTMAIEQQQNVSTASTKREAHIRRLSRNLSAMSSRYLSKSPRGGKQNAVSKPPGSIDFAPAPKPPGCIAFSHAPILEKDEMTFCCSESEESMALQQQQNATAASPKMETPMRRLSRNAVAKPPRNIEFAAAPTPEYFFLVRSPLRGKKNAVSKPSGSKDFGAAPTLENDQVVFFPESEQTMAFQKQQNVTTVSPKREVSMGKLSRHLSAVSARNLKKSLLRGKKNAVSKRSGSKGFAASSPGSTQFAAVAPTPANLLRPPLVKRKNAVSLPPASI